MHDLTITPPSAPELTDEEPTTGVTSAGPLAEQGNAPDQDAEPDPNDSGEAPVKAPRKRRFNAWKERKRAARAARRTPRLRATGRSWWAVAGVVVLALLVLVIVVVGLSVSLGPLRDTALAVHIDPTAASLWWIGVDGLVVVAIIAAVVLRHDPWARWYALGVVAFFTAASGLLQYLHGLGLTGPDQASGADPELPHVVVALVAALVIGTIFCATHLLVYVLRHLFPNAMGDQGGQPAADAGQAAPEVTEPHSSDSDTGDGPADNDRPEPPLLDPETEREVRKWFAAIAIHMILDAGGKPVRSKIARSFEIADRQAGYVIADVTADREEAAERQAEQDAARAVDVAMSGRVGAVNGSGGGA